MLMIAAGYLEKSASKQNFLSFNSQIDGNFHVGDFCLYTYTCFAIQLLPHIIVSLFNL